MANPIHQVDLEKNYLLAVYEGFLKFDEFVDISEESLKLMKQYSIGKVLVDTYKLKVMPMENQLWIQEVWFPKAVQLGLQRIAFIKPENVFGEASAKAANEKAEVEMPVDIAYFSDRGQAENWLLQ